MSGNRPVEGAIQRPSDPGAVREANRPNPTEAAAHAPAPRPRARFHAVSCRPGSTRPFTPCSWVATGLRVVGRAARCSYRPRWWNRTTSSVITQGPSSTLAGEPRLVKPSRRVAHAPVLGDDHVGKGPDGQRAVARRQQQRHGGIPAHSERVDEVRREEGGARTQAAEDRHAGVDAPDRDTGAGQVVGVRGRDREGVERHVVGHVHRAAELRRAQAGADQHGIAGAGEPAGEDQRRSDGSRPPLPGAPCAAGVGPFRTGLACAATAGVARRPRGRAWRGRARLRVGSRRPGRGRRRRPARSPRAARS